MNFLAHTFFSRYNEQELVGNFIGDFVKGNRYTQYPPEIQKGILLHRFIDRFTDTSAIVKESKQVFSPIYGRYSGIIVDVVYDHFLSVHWHSYTDLPRETFIEYVYAVITKYYYSLPARPQKLIPSIIYHNWMRYYASFYGIDKVLSRMAIRTSLPQNTDVCIQVLKSNYSTLEAHFLEFFSDIQQEVLHRTSPIV